MPRFSNMLLEGLRRRGHRVEVWRPKPYFFKLPFPLKLKKWLGYVDQYILFPFEVRKNLRKCEMETLFVFSDHALGPWVPLIAHKPHVIHCHDFLAQFSALNKIPENPTSWTGRFYQAYIRKGYKLGRNFISVSKKTQSDLHSLLNRRPQFSEVIYNGLNRDFKHVDDKERKRLAKELSINLENGFILHVGGNQWYKNRTGVIEIYDVWRENYSHSLPLLLVGSKPTKDLSKRHNSSKYKSDIYILTQITDDLLQVIYGTASVLLFPSLDEGFGWPIAEAMASGCPVITTGQAPMTEVGADVAFYISRRTLQQSDLIYWAGEGASVLENIYQMSTDQRKERINKGFANIKRFDTNLSFEQFEFLYQSILKNEVYS